MYCPKCGMENPEDEKICISCSEPLPVEPDLPPPLPIKTSTLAIWSFVLAIMGLFTLMVTALPALICGIIGLVKISKSSGKLKGTGLAVAGIIISVLVPVFIAVIAMLLAILMPALDNSRQLARKIMCSNNLSSLGKAMVVYVEDYNTYPPADNWCDALVEKCDVTPQQLLCPTDSKEKGKSSYAFNINLAGRKISEVPPDTVLLFETTCAENPVGGQEHLNPEKHQDKGCNILFADGHVKFVKKEELTTLRWKPD